LYAKFSMYDACVVPIRAALLATSLCLGLGCSYDARLSIDVPHWDPDGATAVVSLGGCSGTPLTVGFALIDDRGAPIRDGETIALASGDVTAGASLLTIDLSGAMVTAIPGGQPMTIPDGALMNPRAKSAAAGDVLAVAVEASAGAETMDPDDARVVASELAARAWLATMPRRVVIYDFANAAVDQRLPPGSDVNAAATAIEAIGDVQGGDAPIFDGTIAAATAIRAASVDGGAVLLVGAGLVDRGSVAGATDTITALAGTPHVPLFAAALADSADVRQIACTTNGAFALVTDPTRLSTTAVALAGAVGGSWTAQLTPPAGLSTGTYRIDGMLTVKIAGEMRTAPLTLTFDVP
jgi:hypothetical protein